MKSVKRILLGNVDPITGKLDNENAVRALMTHCNTLCNLTRISPAVTLFGRPIRDHLPICKVKLEPEWREIKEKREEALSKRHITKTTLQAPSRELQLLHVGDYVQIQNQNRTRTNKWNSTGFITETLPNRQYFVVVDRSCRATLRNKRFLKQISLVCRKGNDNLSAPLAPSKEIQQPARFEEHENNDQQHPTTQSIPATNAREECHQPTPEEQPR